ncbi:four helix bundle protein, partial [Candidatus Kuenenbacteria bacterium]|nr:four helix bundle protein [Candidatus Kuenenbacteria bacterium]
MENNNNDKKVKTFKDIFAWQKAHQVVIATYKLTEGFPDTEKFALVVQMRRAAVSIASNIVEGFARKKIKETLQFYNIAAASLEE